jgi:hypothetical protein
VGDLYGACGTVRACALGQLPRCAHAAIEARDKVSGVAVAIADGLAMQ